MSTFYNLENHDSAFNYRPYSLIANQKIHARNIDKSIIAELPESLDLGETLKRKDQKI